MQEEEVLVEGNQREGERVRDRETYCSQCCAASRGQQVAGMPPEVSRAEGCRPCAE